MSRGMKLFFYLLALTPMISPIFFWATFCELHFWTYYSHMQGPPPARAALLSMGGFVFGPFASANWYLFLRAARRPIPWRVYTLPGVSWLIGIATLDLLLTNPMLNNTAIGVYAWFAMSLCSFTATCHWWREIYKTQNALAEA